MKTQKYLDSKKLSIVLFVFMFVMYATVYMTKNMFSAAMAVIVENGVMTKSQTGLITAVFWLVYAPFQVVGGFAADKYSPYKLIVIGLVGIVLCNLIIYFNQSYGVILTAWTVNAMLQFGLWPGVFKIVSTQTAPEIRGKAVFWLLLSTNVGLGLSMFVASFVKKWQDNFIFSAIFGIVMLVLFIVVYRILEKRMTEKEMVAPNSESKPEMEKTPMMPLAIASGLTAMCIICLLRTSIDNGIKMMTPVMLMESYDNLPAAIATRLSTILVVFSVVGTFTSGFVKECITGNEAKAQIILFGLSIPILVITLFIGKISYIWILLSLALVVGLVHGAAPFCQSFASIRYDRYGRIGTVSGILNAAASVGNVLASYVFAKMAEYMPWNKVVLFWMLIAAICVALCTGVLKRWTRFINNEIKL